jgi:hypothetical protein
MTTRLHCLRCDTPLENSDAAVQELAFCYLERPRDDF